MGPKQNSDAWTVAQTIGKNGTGNWLDFNMELDEVYRAAEKWKKAISGINKPWLCWNIYDKWSVLQQKLVLEVGWTPVVGWDPNCVLGPPPIVPGAISVNFNEDLQFKALWPHFPLEFAFLWSEKLAFWHADLLVRMEKLEKIVSLFEGLKNNEMAAVLSIGGRRNLLNFRSHRYWELLGCITKGASESQFQLGCGWWRHFYKHPNCPPSEKEKRSKYYYDSGVGIMYWKRKYKGKVYNIKAKWIEEGHCTRIGNKNYKRGISKSEEMDLNFDLQKIANKLGLEKFL